MQVLVIHNIPLKVSQWDNKLYCVTLAANNQLLRENLCFYTIGVLARGYQKWSLDRAYSIASNKNRRDLFFRQRNCNIKSDRSERPSLALTYSLVFKQIKYIVNNYLFLHYNVQMCAQVLDKGIYIVARRVKSLGSNLSPVFFFLNLGKFQLNLSLGFNARAILDVVLVILFVVSVVI